MEPPQPSPIRGDYELVDRLNNWREVTKEALGKYWDRLKDTLRQDLKIQDEDNAEIKNILIDGALDEALFIREREGFIFRHESAVFPDVMWEEVALRPIIRQIKEEKSQGTIYLGEVANASIVLSLPEDQFSWKRYKRDGTLEPALARALWPENLWDYVLPALASSGLVLPVSVDEEDIILVLPRLRLARPPSVIQDLSCFIGKQDRVLRAEWGIPPGISWEVLEKIIPTVVSIARECTFWRSGVLAKGVLSDGNEWSGIYALLLEYSYDTNALVMEVYGNVRSEVPWLVQSYTMSAALKVALDEPRLTWNAFVRCPEDDDRCLPVSNRAQKPGDRLLDEKMTCSESDPNAGGLGDFAIAMLTVVNTTRSSGEIFQEAYERYVQLKGSFTALRSEGISDRHHEGLLEESMPSSGRRPAGESLTLGGTLFPEEPLTLVTPSQWSVGQFRLRDDQVRLYVGERSCQRGQVAGPISVSSGYRLLSCGDQFLTSRVVDCQPSGMKFDEPIKLDFLVGHYWDRSHEEALMDVEAYRQHLREKCKVLWREDNKSGWHLLEEKQTEMLEEDGTFLLRSSIEHFCDFSTGQPINREPYKVETFRWYGWNRPKRDEIWFTNATAKELTIFVWPSVVAFQNARELVVSLSFMAASTSAQLATQHQSTITPEATRPQKFVLPAAEGETVSENLPLFLCTMSSSKTDRAMVTMMTKVDTTYDVWFENRCFKTRSHVTVLPGLFRVRPVRSLGFHLKGQF